MRPFALLCALNASVALVAALPGAGPAEPSPMPAPEVPLAEPAQQQQRGKGWPWGKGMKDNIWTDMKEKMKWGNEKEKWGPGNPHPNDPNQPVQPPPH